MDSELEKLIAQDALVDLHIHTTASDGVYTPQQLLAQLLAAHIRVFAFTDHDSCANLHEGATLARQHGLRFLPGIELGTQHAGRAFHVLGYGIDPDNAPLLTKIAQLRHGRELRLLRILEKLQALGMPLTPEQVDAQDRAVGRPHVARALVQHGYVTSYQEAFEKYLGRGKPAYEPQPKLLPVEAVALIHQAGGRAVLAHPEEVGSAELVREVLDQAAWDGLEVYHPSCPTAAGQAGWRAEAQRRGLLVTGGDDFHGNAGRFPEQLGVFCVHAAQVADFLRASLGAQ